MQGSGAQPAARKSLPCNIGIVYQLQGQYPEALEVYRKVLAIGIKIHGHNHPAVAKTYGNMGCVYDLMGDFPKALEYHNYHLEIKL